MSHALDAWTCRMMADAFLKKNYLFVSLYAYGDCHNFYILYFLVYFIRKSKLPISVLPFIFIIKKKEQHKHMIYPKLTTSKNLTTAIIGFVIIPKIINILPKNLHKILITVTIFHQPINLTHKTIFNAIAIL